MGGCRATITHGKDLSMGSIVVSVRVGNRTLVEQEWEPDIRRLDEEASELGRKIGRAAFQAAVQREDERLMQGVGKGWRNRGKQRRWVLTSVGHLCIVRRVYEDGDGCIWKPLDEAMGLEAYQRATSYVEGLGTYLATHESYRVTAEVLGRMVGEWISPTRIQHMVWGVGQDLDDREMQEREEAFGRGAELGGGREAAPMLFGESDGIIVSLQREATRRAEVRVGLVYTGKEQVGQGRWRLTNKVAVTAMTSDSEVWQEMMLKAAHQAFDLGSCGCLVTGGDAGSWVRHTFDRFELPGVFQLDRYHLWEWARRMPRGSQGEVMGLLKEAMADGYEQVEERLWWLAERHTGEPRAKLEWLCRILSRNRDGVWDYRRQLGLVEDGRRGLGAIEGNVDKLVGQRMKGRGRSWRKPGVRGMLAAIRNRSKLREHTLMPTPVSSFQERPSVPSRHQVRDADYLYHPVPIIHSHFENDPEVKWLKRRIDGKPILSFPTVSPSRC
jgi:hypothetical protein